MEASKRWSVRICRGVKIKIFNTDVKIAYYKFKQNNTVILFNYVKIRWTLVSEFTVVTQRSFSRCGVYYSNVSKSVIHI